MSAPATAVSSRQRRTAARLTAVQALYEMEVAGATADAVLQEMRSRRLPAVDNGETRALIEPDLEFLDALVRGVDSRRQEVDQWLVASLTPPLELGRLEVLLRAILRAGAFELLAMPDVPANVVITEYLHLTHAFFAGREPSLVNGVLDRLATHVRARDAE
jgi:N utilization substance protein B